MRRPLAHAVAFGLRRVTGANRDANLCFRQTPRDQSFANAGKRRFQIAMDIV